MDLRTTIDKHGRMLIPASIRKELDYYPGDTIVLRSVDGELRAIKIEQVVAETQEIIRKHLKSDASLVEELFQMRKEEFIKENSSDKK